MSSDRERDRRSLQDLAKLAANTTTPAPSSVRFDVGPLSSPASSRKDEDSGLVNLMAFAPQAEPAPASVKAPPPPPSSVAPASVSAGPASVRPSAVVAGPPASMPAPSSIGAAVVSSAAPSIDAPLSGPEVAAASAAVPSVPVVAMASSKEEKKGNGKVIAIGGLFAAAAIAAGVFFATRKPVEEPSAMNAPPVAAAPAPKAPEKTETTQAAEPAKDEPASATPAAKTPVAKAVVGGPAIAKVDKEKVEAKEDKKVEAKDLPSSAGGSNDLGAAMRQAAGPGANTESGDKNTGPQFAAGSVPQKPSQGAITGALGAVLGQARSCVAEDDPISRANVTFASAGNVQSVSVSGGAAGKPAEACIKAALSKAHVAPFAEATYSAPVTIRH